MKYDTTALKTATVSNKTYEKLPDNPKCSAIVFTAHNPTKNASSIIPLKTIAMKTIVV